MFKEKGIVVLYVIRFASSLKVLTSSISRIGCHNSKSSHKDQHSNTKYKQKAKVQIMDVLYLFQKLLEFDIHFLSGFILGYCWLLVLVKYGFKLYITETEKLSKEG
jgi:hypothetical protein